MSGSVPVPAPPEMAASAYILQDFHSGEIIAEENADMRIEPASITKIMTTYVVFDAIRNGRLSLDDKALISEKAWRNPEVPGWMQGSRMFAEVNTRVSIADLLRGLIIQSGNDASVALAEHVGGTEAAFVDIMNAYVEKLGLTNTHYLNSTGWPVEGHYTSARDVATLSRALIRDFPELYQMFSERRFTYNNISQSNRNTLLWKDDSVDGIKTGHTESAGYCLAASAERDGMRLLAVVMGTADNDARIKYSQSLLNYGFRFFETARLFAGNDSIKDVRVWKGGVESVQVGLAEDLYVTIPRGEYDNLKSTMNVRRDVFAPVEQHEVLGQLIVELNGEAIREVPLIAFGGVERGNIFQRIIDHVVYMLE
ncbi:MAG TPA: D-alanyl-D-alanine carboxypeptidase family protein [Gammaproteobacteria bacterium]